MEFTFIPLLYKPMCIFSIALFSIPYIFSLCLARYFQENPNETAMGIMSQFSFETPRPLQKNYVKKCGPSVSRDRNATRMPKNNEPIEGVL